MKHLSLAASLLGLSLLTCSRAPTLLVTVENIPATALSLQLTATHSNLAAIMNLEPLELPQPTQPTSTFLLRLPAAFTGDIGVNVGAFKAAGGTGCLLGTGTMTTAMFAGPDDTMRVPLTAATDTACTGNPVSLNTVTPGQGNVTGNETITLNGWGFKPGATVTFNSTVARMVTYVSAAQLKILTPAKAGFGLTPIKISNADGSSASRSDLFRFYADAIDFTSLPFQPTGDYSNGNGFVFGLFNAATTLDAAIAQQAKDYVRILLVTGTTTASVDYPMPAGSMPTGISAADFNKDGNLDVVVNTQSDSMVRILFNDGKGNLTPGGTATVGKQPEAIVAADLNGDGNADVAVANRMDNSVTILLGDGKGGFTSQATVTNLTDPASLAVGDVNADGQPDLVVANASTGTVTILFNNHGDFSGQSGNARAGLQIGKTISSVLVTDINNDGKIDILAADTGNNKVLVIQNMGIPNILQYSLATELGPKAVQAGDLNGDGFPDLVVPCNGTNSVDIYLNNGQGFAGVTYKSYMANCTGPAQAAIYDIDRDGRLDVGVLCQMGIGLLINHSGL